MAYSIRFPRRHDKTDRNGRYAVRLCITKNKRRKYIALDLYADPAYWDEAGEQFLILRNLKARPWRFNELQRDLEGISQKVLTDSLRQMIDDGLAYRRDYQEMPPRVEYGLTDLGREMLPIIDALADFGNYYQSLAHENAL